MTILKLSKYPSTWDYAPLPYLEIAADFCPSSVKLYLKLWKQRNEQNVLEFMQSEIEDLFLMEKIEFWRKLRPLAEQALLSYEKKDKVIKVEILDWSEEDHLDQLG